jgi:hypothetical protein
MGRDGQLRIADSGFLCPAFDVHSRIVGCQVRLDNTTDNKYRWLRGHFSSHLPSGELPLTVARGNGQGIGLIEGILKPQVSALRFGGSLIGAAAGLFQASSQQLQDALACLSQEQGTDQVTLYPDAGGAGNRHVYRRDCETIRLVQSWGYQVQVAGWGQFEDTTQPDFDELPSTEQIKFISADEYLALKPQKPQKHAQRDQQISADEWEKQFGLPNLFKSLVEQVKGSFKGIDPNSPKNHVLEAEKRNTERIATPVENYINYQPGCIPWFEQWRGKLSKIICKTNADMKLAYSELVQKGWEDILDTTPPALGKSHGVGELTPGMFFAPADEEQQNQHKLIYLSDSPRNPTTPSVERNFHLLPSRTDDDLIKDESRQTGLGNPFIRHTRKGETGDQEQNCIRTDEHRAIQDKNLGIGASNSRSVGDKAQDDNPICNTCPVLQDCRASMFKAEMKEACQHTCLRSSIPGTPGSLAKDNGVIFDDNTHSPVKQITVKLQDLSHVFELLRFRLPEVHKTLHPLVREPLEQRLNGVVKAPNFGWDLAEIGEIFADAIASLDDQTINELQQFTQQQRGKDLKLISGDSKADDIDRWVMSDWLVTFLEVLREDTPGALRLDNHQLVTTIRDERYMELINSSGFTIRLDGTKTREQWALEIERKPDEIAEVSLPKPEYPKLKINQIEIRGLSTKERSQLCQNRVNELVSKFEKQGRHGAIDWLAHLHSGALAHHSGGRSSNEYSDKTTLSIVGVPYKNLSAVQDKFQTLTGRQAHLGTERSETNPELQAYIDTSWQAEYIQECHRIRPARRTDERLTINCITPPGLNLSFLENEFGVTVQQVDPVTITPAAGSPEQRLRYASLQLIEGAYTAGKSIKGLTQQQIAAQLGITQARLAKSLNP